VKTALIIGVVLTLLSQSTTPGPAPQPSFEVNLTPIIVAMFALIGAVFGGGWWWTRIQARRKMDAEAENQEQQAKSEEANRENIISEAAERVTTSMEKYMNRLEKELKSAQAEIERLRDRLASAQATAEAERKKLRERIMELEGHIAELERMIESGTGIKSSRPKRKPLAEPDPDTHQKE
jgi:flagellar motility protein MotE (MotC chaperone)